MSGWHLRERKGVSAGKVKMRLGDACLAGVRGVAAEHGYPRWLGLFLRNFPLYHYSIHRIVVEQHISILLLFVISKYTWCV